MFGNVNDNSTVSGIAPLYGHGASLNASTAPVCVQYKVSKSANFTHVESQGTVYTSSDIDYTVKV
jgi:alkaline phosphatase D